MATPTYATVISQINTYIVANGNNEITANVLNPILKVITDFANNTIGNLGALTTTDTDTIVGSINSLKLAFDNLNNNGVQLLTGYDDPNVTPPPTFNYADFYMELDITDDSPVQLWQWSGSEWTTYSSVYSKAEIDAIVTAIYAAIGTATGISNVVSKRYAGSGQTYILPTGAIAFQASINDYPQWPEEVGFESDLNTFTQIGTTLTFKETIETDSRIRIMYYF